MINMYPNLELHALCLVQAPYLSTGVCDLKKKLKKWQMKQEVIKQWMN